MSDEPISGQRLRELQELAWNPEYEPPAEMEALRYRHQLLRDAVREIERIRGRRTGFHQMRALLEVLGEHRIMYREPPHGEQPKPLTDLMEWAFVAAVAEVADVEAERDAARAQLAELGEEWGSRYKGGEMMRGYESEADVRSGIYPGVTIHRRAVGPWIEQP